MKKKRLALLLAVALTVTSVEGTVSMVSGADFASEVDTEAEVLTAEAEENAVETDQNQNVDFTDIIDSEAADVSVADTDEAEPEVSIQEADEADSEFTDGEDDIELQLEEDGTEAVGEGAEQPNLTGIKVTRLDENTMFSGVTGINYYVSAKITLTFDDETTSDFIFPLGKTSYADEKETKGYTIEASLRRGPEGTDLMGQKLSAPDWYYLYFKCKEDEKISTEVRADIKTLEDGGMCQGEVTTGENPILSVKNAYRYYKFVPERNGIYTGKITSTNCVPWVEDKDADNNQSYKMYKKLEGNSWQLEANEPVYFQVYGADTHTVLTLKEVPQLASISTTQEKVTLLENYETYHGEAISSLLRFNYTNQETEDVDIKFGYIQYSDSDGNMVLADLVYADGENKGKSFVWKDVNYVPVGSYKYIFTLMEAGKESITAEASLKVESLTDRYDQFESITEGTQEIDITNRQFYKFEPEVTGDYMIGAETGLSYLVIEVNKNGTTQRLAEENGRVSCKFEQGHKYVIDIYNHTPDITSTNLTLQRLPKTESVEIVSYAPQNLSFIQGLAPEFNFIKVRINTEKGSEVRKLNYGGISGGQRDSYGKTLEYCLYKKENDQYKEMDYGDVYNLEAGEYVYRVFYDDVEATSSIPVHIASFQEMAPLDQLKEGESKTLSAKNNQISASYLARFTGRHQFEFNKKVNVYFVAREVGASKTYSNVSEFCENLTRANGYYLYITSDTGLEDLQIKVTELQAPKKLEILADNNEYIAGIDNLSNINLRTRVTYSDGSEQIIGMNDPVYGGKLSYRASAENGKTAEASSVLTEGEWTCVPYIYEKNADISLSGTEIIGTTIKVILPNAENLETLEEGVPETVKPVKRKFYKFVPKTSGPYETTVSDGSTVNIYSIYNGRLSNYTYLIGDETYFVMVSTPYSIDLQIKKEEYVEGDTYVMGEKYDQTFDLNDAEPPLYFTFEPAETGYYKFWTEGNAYSYVELYDDDDQIGGASSYESANVILTAKLEKGKTYAYVVGWTSYAGSDLTVHFAKTEHQSIKSLELVPKKGVTKDAMTVMNGVLDVYDLRINYADHSVLVENAVERRWGEYAYEGSDEYGNKWQISLDNSVADLGGKDTQYEIKLIYQDPEENDEYQNTVRIPVKGTEGVKIIENGTSVNPFQNNGLSSWFAFTPSESGEYILQSETEKGEAIPNVYICGYNIVKYGDYSFIQENSVRTEKITENSEVAILNEGETYLVGISRNNMDCNKDISFKIEKTKKVKNVVRTKAPDQTTVYNTEGNVAASLEGMILTVYYADGTTEDVAYGESDAAGYEITVAGKYWKDADTYTVNVLLRNYYIQVDYKRVNLPEEIQEVIVGSSTKIPASDQVTVPVRFIPDKTGYYFVDVENGSVSSVQKQATQAPKQSRMSGTKTSSDAGDTQYFEENQTYLIYIYTNKKEATVTIREGACKWETIAGTIVKISCITGESCEQECKVHNHTRVVEGDKAYGHSYSSWKVTREADCTNAGEKQRTCIYCGYVEKISTMPATGHSYSEWKTTKQPTCTVNGTEERTCANCNNTEKRTIKATGQHKFGDWVQTREPDVLTEGHQERSCSVCGQKETQATAKLKATIALNVSGTIPLKTKQTFNAKVTTGKGDKVASWKSSNKKVVSVSSSGKIKGLKAGKTATITVQLQSGLKKSFKVKVQKKAVATKSLKVADVSTGKKISSKISMKSKQTLKLMTTVSPVTSKEKVKYSSSNKKVVSVSSKGVIKAKKKGKATITVKSGKKTYKIKITVK